jgi:hypothetical protein
MDAVVVAVAKQPLPHSVHWTGREPARFGKKKYLFSGGCVSTMRGSHISPTTWDFHIMQAPAATNGLEGTHEMAFGSTHE